MTGTGQCPQKRLIVICGLSFAGKSTLGDAICAALGHAQVDVDETKSELYGPGIADEDLSADDWARIYRETDERIARHLRQGRSAVDASRNFRRGERDRARALAERLGAGAVVVYVDAPEGLVRRRRAENRKKPTRRDISDRGFEEVISCARCDWSATEEEFLKSNRKKHLHAGRMEPFIEAFVEDFKKARDARTKMLLIDILIHRCHGDYEGSEGLRPGAINLIGGKPREVLEFLDRLGGIRRSGLDAETGHEDWVERVRRERPGGWR